MLEPWQIMLVEDHTLLRTALKALLSQDQDFKVVGEAGNGRDALHAVVTLKPHVVLMDISMPGMNGIEAITESSGAFLRRASSCSLFTRATSISMKRYTQAPTAMS